MLFIWLLRYPFREIGHDDTVADAAFEAEDPEGLINEGMPPSLNHVDPTILNKLLYVVLQTCMLFY